VRWEQVVSDGYDGCALSDLSPVALWLKRQLKRSSMRKRLFRRYLARCSFKESHREPFEIA